MSSLPSSDASHVRNPAETQLKIKESSVPKLADSAMQILQEQSVRKNGHRTQVYVGIAGAPGSGKSTLADKVAMELNCQHSQSDQSGSFAVVIPMDGYHIRQADLLKEAMARLAQAYGNDSEEAQSCNALRPSPTYEDVMKRRGAPWTFDSKRLFHDLHLCKQTGSGSFPMYDRGISDPVPDQIHVADSSGTKIVLCEGNYLLAFDDPEWQPLQSIWDDTWLLQVEEAELKHIIIGRSMKNWNAQKQQLFGTDALEGATDKAESNDMKNTRFVYDHSPINSVNVLIDNN
jgi:pantothenate kinase